MHANDSHKQPEKGKPMITDIAHICIAAHDLNATERFYCEGLHLRKCFDFLKEGTRIGFYLEVTAGRYIEVFLRDYVESDNCCPIMHLCLQVKDIDSVRRHLIEFGAEVTEKKLGADNSWQLWAKDPGGVRIEFHQYTPNSSQLTGKNCVLD